MYFWISKKQISWRNHKKFLQIWSNWIKSIIGTSIVFLVYSTWYFQSLSTPCLSILNFQENLKWKNNKKITVTKYNGDFRNRRRHERESETLLILSFSFKRAQSWAVLENFQLIFVWKKFQQFFRIISFYVDYAWKVIWMRLVPYLEDLFVKRNQMQKFWNTALESRFYLIVWILVPL